MMHGKIRNSAMTYIYVSRWLAKFFIDVYIRLTVLKGLKSLDLPLIFPFSEQIWQTISLSQIDSDHKLLIKVATQVTTYVTRCF